MDYASSTAPAYPARSKLRIRWAGVALLLILIASATVMGLGGWYLLSLAFGV